ncbi:MAG: B12-binding domain-containing radical SAM protein [Phycisphaerae bacterium]
MVYATPARPRRIRLINPNSPLSNITMPEIIRKMTFTRKALFAPTGLTICAQVMPQDWDVEVVDECTLEAPHKPKADVELVGVSAMTPQARRAYEIADEYRRLGVTVIMGGIHPSALPEEASQHCDAVCKGDAESTLPHLIADWEAAIQRGDDPRTGIRSVYDWAAYPAAEIATPRKDLLDPRDYLVANPIQTTRGCPHTCNFCTTPAVFGRKFRQRRIADIVEEIREANERYKAWCYIFADDNFGGKHGWAIELCEALKPLRIAWATQCDVMISKNDRLLKAMRESGCVGLILGLESPKQDTLSEAGKRFVRSDTYGWRIRKIQSFGISLWGAFIFGFDHDTWRDCRDACQFAQRMNLAMSCYPILTPYPGTEFFRQFEREGRIRTYDWERYNGASVVYEPRRMTPKQLRHAQMAAFAEFFSPGSAFRRLKLYPLKSRAWVANLAIWKGIRHYYATRRRRVPAFRDFLNPASKAWDYPDEQRTGAPKSAERAVTMSPCGQEDVRRASESPFEVMAATAVVHADPFVQAGVALRTCETPALHANNT